MNVETSSRFPGTVYVTAGGGMLKALANSFRDVVRVGGVVVTPADALRACLQQVVEEHKRLFRAAIGVVAGPDLHR